MVGRKCDLLLFRLLGEKDGLDVGQDTTLGDGDSREKFVQLVVTDGK